MINRRQDVVYFLPHVRLQGLLDALNEQYTCIGPRVKNGAIVYDALNDANQLPWGTQDVQSKGRYRLQQTNTQRAFDWANASQSIKPFLFKSEEVLWYSHKQENGELHFEPATVEERPLALFGVRPCDIAAMQIQDRVFMDGPYVDVRYKKRRESLLTVVVNCTRSSENCFCVSAGFDTEAKQGFDISMTEMDDGFVVYAITEPGHAMLASLKLDQAAESTVEMAQERVKQAALSQTKTLPAVNLTETLRNRLAHSHWDKVAKRCLACANCTLVCPTCFCHNELDRLSLDGSKSEHIRQWDSCFTSQHSHLFSGAVRQTTKDYYRQWLTHKLGNWKDQFGVSGCVGCGRCITWCPVGIDITEEVKALVISEVEENSDV